MAEGWRDALSDPRLVVSAADRALAAGATQTALEAYQRAATLDPANRDALHGLAAVLTLQQQWQKSLAVYRQILAQHPDDKVALFNSGLLFMQLEQYQQAEAAYLELLRQDPTYFRARYNLASLYQAQGKLGQAHKVYRELLESAAATQPAMADTEAAAAWHAYGQLLMDLHQYEPAMNAFAKSAKLQGTFDAWLNMGLAACACGNYGHAAVAATGAQKLAAQDPQAWLDIGRLWLDIHRGADKKEFLASAVQAWKTSLSLKADQPDVKKLVQTYEGMVKP